MGRAIEGALFAGLSAVGFALVIGWTASFPMIQDPSLKGPRCFTQYGTTSYDFLSQKINEGLCVFNVIFQALKKSDAALLLVNQFAAVVFVIVVIISYETFRQKNFLARRGHFFLFFSQILTAAAMFPAYYAVVAYTRTPATMSRRPTAPQVWSVLLAALLGYLGPTYMLAKEGWSYDSLSIWQIYPVYVTILNAILPTILRPFTKNRSPLTPIYLILAVAVYLSATAHFKMLASGVDFQDIYLLRSPPATLSGEAHRLFLVDYLCSTLTTAIFLVLTFDSATTEHKVGYLFVLMAAANIVGPGAALAIVWALRESFAPQPVIAQRTAKIETSLARKQA